MSCSLAADIQCSSCSDLRSLISTFKFQILLARLCVALSYCIRFQKKEEEKSFKMMHETFHELFALLLALIFYIIYIYRWCSFFLYITSFFQFYTCYNVVVSSPIHRLITCHNGIDDSGLNLSANKSF